MVLPTTPTWSSGWAASRGGMATQPSPLLSPCYKHTSSASSQGTAALGPPTAPFVWRIRHSCRLPAFSTQVCSSPLLVINTSLSYLPPFPHLLAWPSFPSPPTADITTATSPKQVPTSIQLFQSVKRRLPIFSACPGLFTLRPSCSASCFPLCCTDGSRPPTHQALVHSHRSCVEPGEDPSPGPLTTPLTSCQPWRCMHVCTHQPYTHTTHTHAMPGTHYLPDKSRYTQHTVAARHTHTRQTDMHVYRQSRACIHRHTMFTHTHEPACRHSQRDTHRACVCLHEIRGQFFLLSDIFSHHPNSSIYPFNR